MTKDVRLMFSARISNQLLKTRSQNLGGFTTWLNSQANVARYEEGITVDFGIIDDACRPCTISHMACTYQRKTLTVALHPPDLA
jgi:hypothetical protein